MAEPRTSNYFVVLPPLALLVNMAAGVLAWLDGATLPGMHERFAF
jgi:hypothetical protein